LIFIKNK